MSLCEVTAHAQWSQNIDLDSGSLFWSPTRGVQGFECCAMIGPLKKQLSICQRSSGNLLIPLGNKNKDHGAALQTLLTWVKLRLPRMLFLSTELIS